MSYTISKEFTFSASHQLDGLPSDHPCSRLHGHNYVVKLSLTGELDAVGFVFDYRKLDPFKRYLDETLDHWHLNDVVHGNPTAERLSAYLLGYVSEVLRFPRNVHSVSVAVSETGKTWAESAPLVILQPEELDAERYRWNNDAWTEPAPVPAVEHHIGSLNLTGEGK